MKRLVQLAGMVVLAFSALSWAQTTRPTTLSTPPVMIGQPIPAVPAILVTCAPAQANGDSWPVIQPQINKAGPGSVISLIRGNTYYISQALQVANMSGITIDLMGAKIKALPTIAKGPWAAGCLFWVQGSSQITIRNGSLDGSAKARGGFNGAAHNIDLAWSNHVLIDGITSAGAPCDDVFMSGGTGNPNGSCTYIRITRCNFTGAIRNAVSVVDGQYVTIDHNQFHDLQKTIVGAGVDIESTAIDPVGSNHDIVVAFNSFTNCWHGVYGQSFAGAMGLTCIGNACDRCEFPLETDMPQSTVLWNTITNATNFPIIAGAGVSVNDNSVLGSPAPLAVATPGVNQVH